MNDFVPVNTVVREMRDIKIERLENIVSQLCEVVTDADYSWRAWADPLKQFMNEIKQEREDSR
jgi:nitrate reductase assembly molybdenum cofactor insertion protein NarJ